jgi:hypothetical protein
MAEFTAALTTAVSNTLDRALAPVRGFREWLEDGMPMPGSGTVGVRDRRRWREAASMEDLCALTASWLSGEIGSQPGYYGRVDVDDDLAPGMATTLIALNRMGFLTRQSQAGHDGPGGYAGDDDVHWTACAAIEGFASPEIAEKLQAALAGTRFEIRVENSRLPDAPFVQGQVVAHVEGSPNTWFGGRLRAEEIGFEFEGTSAAAVAAVQETLQVTIQDPTPGPNDLWTHLNAAAQNAATAPAEAPPSHPTPPSTTASRPEAIAALVARSRPEHDTGPPTYITIGRYRAQVRVPPA